MANVGVVKQTSFPQSQCRFSLKAHALSVYCYVKNGSFTANTCIHLTEAATVRVFKRIRSVPHACTLAFSVCAMNSYALVFMYEQENFKSFSTYLIVSKFM